MTAILSLAPFQERHLWQRFRAQAHEALDRLLDGLETRMTDADARAPTLMEIVAVTDIVGDGLV